MKIALDIGHCSTGDRGAVSRDGLAEHDFWKEHAPTIVKMLERLGHQVRIFRREDYSRRVANECIAINAWGADVAVSLHLNDSNNPTCKGGHEMIHYDGSRKGKALAKAIDAQFDLIAQLADRNTRTPYKGRGETFLSKTACPAVIVEAAFLSVAGDVNYLRTKGEVLAAAVAHGIHAWSVTCGA